MRRNVRRLITFEENQIVFRVDMFIYKIYKVDFLQEFEDIVVRNYNNHEIVFEDHDGNNVNHPEFRSWLNQLCCALNIPVEKIIFKTQIPPQDPYQWIPQRDLYKVSDVDFNTLNTDMSGAKFVGCLAASRPSTARMRLIYELGTTFGDDAFLTFRPQDAVNRLQIVSPDIFSKEIDWFQQRQFNNDYPADTVCLDMLYASHGYWNIWNQFQIEVVCETDEYMSTRFTDKVAKPLSSGKPFLLLCGKNSLQHLKNLGFVTFDQYIDESYDQCQLPNQRIQAMTASLLELYKSPNRDKLIKKMYKHAKQNIEVYQQVTPWIDEDSYAGTEKEKWGHFPTTFR